MPNNVIKWGVLTAGRITHTFAQDIMHCKDTYIHGVATRRLADAQAFASQYGIPHAYEGYHRLYEDPDIDAIYIASPHTFHVDQAAAALKAGKHVLCEKPITTCVKDLEYLISLAKEHQCFLMEAMWTYFLPAIRVANEWVKRGEIGELVSLRADFGYPIPYSPDRREYDARFAGGCIFEMGIYPIAFDYLFSNASPTAFHKSLRHAPNGVEDDAVWQIEHDSFTSSLHTSFKSKLPNIAYLIGTKGTIAIPDFWRTTKAELYELEKPKLEFHDHRVGSGFEFQIEHACECIRAGKIESDVVTFAASLAFQEHIATIREVKELS